MQRHLEQRFFIRHFNDPAEIHHRHAVADMFHDSKIVRHKQVRKLEFLLQVHHQIDDLGLDRYVQRRHWFVPDDQGGA